MTSITSFICASCIGSLLFIPFAFASKEVTLQLRWYHQYQFAGYYMAKEKGYYDDFGLNVHIKEANPGQTQPINSIIKREADFAIDNSALVVSYLEGDPVVALAAINQTSPLVWISLKSSNIRIVQDLPGHSLMSLPQPAHSELLALLKQEGIPRDSIKVIPSSFNINDLIDGKVDVFYGYQSNEPYSLKQQNVDFHLIKPREYGINFYSDVLFTHSNLATDDPEMVQAFLKASLKGWHYAMNNINETVDVISDKYTQSKTKDHLLYEAHVLKESILPDLVQIGHMNPGRWHYIASTYQNLGVTNSRKNLDDFLFNYEKSSNYLPYLIAISIASILLLLTSYFVYRFKRLSIALEKSNHELAYIAIIDPLTGIMNRRGFMENAERLLSISKRHNNTACLMLLDIDHFKKINDQYGHTVGDFCLIEFCEIVQSCCRLHDLVARVGGEEFIILLDDCSTSQAKEKANYILKRIREHSFQPNGIDGDIHITVSIGICMVESSLHQAWQYADEALYHVKRNGRNGIQIHSEIPA